MPTQFVKPILVVSRCFEFDACRYNGLMIPNPLVRMLIPHVEFRPICPEMEIGLGTPRDPIRIVVENGQRRLVQPSTGEDLTEAMDRFSDQFLSALQEVDGFLLKGRSPSCGVYDAKEFPSAEGGPGVGRKKGFFAQAVHEKFEGMAIEDEGRLTNLSIRDHFLTKLFLWARFRKLKQSGKMRDLVHFQSSYKLLLMAYNQSQMRQLGRIVANPDQHPVSHVFSQYEATLKKVFARPVRRPAMINALMHGMGYFSKQLSAREKAFFLDTLEDYRIGKVPVATPLYLLHSWVVRFEELYLSQQVLFMPYPEELIMLKDSGKRV